MKSKTNLIIFHYSTKPEIWAPKLEKFMEGAIHHAFCKTWSFSNTKYVSLYTQNCVRILICVGLSKAINNSEGRIGEWDTYTDTNTNTFMYIIQTQKLGLNDELLSHPQYNDTEKLASFKKALTWEISFGYFGDFAYLGTSASEPASSNELIWAVIMHSVLHKFLFRSPNTDEMIRIHEMYHLLIKLGQYQDFKKKWNSQFKFFIFIFPHDSKFVYFMAKIQTDIQSILFKGNRNWVWTLKR